MGYLFVCSNNSNCFFILLNNTLIKQNKRLLRQSHDSETNNNPHFVKIICDNVEWVDNVNCPKNGNSKPLEVVLQRVVKQVSGNWLSDNARPFAMWRELFLENYEEIE